MGIPKTNQACIGSPRVVGLVPCPVDRAKFSICDGHGGVWTSQGSRSNHTRDRYRKRFCLLNFAVINNRNGNRLGSFAGQEGDGVKDQVKVQSGLRRTINRQNRRGDGLGAWSVKSDVNQPRCVLFVDHQIIDRNQNILIGTDSANRQSINDRCARQSSYSDDDVSIHIRKDRFGKRVQRSCAGHKPVDDDVTGF